MKLIEWHVHTYTHIHKKRNEKVKSLFVCVSVYVYVSCSSSLTSSHVFAAVSRMRVWGCAWLMMGLRNGSLLPSLLSALTLLPQR